MATYNRQAISIMARGSGWGSKSDDVSWVAMAESSGNASDVNSIGCVGLLQINQPVHVGSHPKWTVSWLKDPMNNLAAGLVLYNAAGKKFDGPWLDSRDKGGGGGWGSHVSGGGSTGTDQIGDDPCAGFILPGLGKDNPAYKDCTSKKGDLGGGGGDGLGDALGLGGIGDLADQMGRLAQDAAKAGNWLAEPKNWVRVAYVAGGALLGVTAVAVIIRPYTMSAYRQIAAALPVRTSRKVARRVRESGQKEETSD